MQQRSDEWLELRKTKIGASDAPIIMGVGFKTPLQLWEQKLGLVEPDPVTSAMQRGIDLEPRILEMFNSRIGNTFTPSVRISEQHPWMMASLDGLCEATGEIVEIKAGNGPDHEQCKHGFVPSKYYPQLQHQMAVCGVDSVYYCSYFNEEIVITRVERNPEYIDSMIRAELEFFACMASGKPPELTDRDYSEWDSSLEGTLAELREIMSRRLELDNREKAIKKRLAEVVVRPMRGFGIRVTKCTRQGSIDYDAIPQLQGVNLEEYRKASTSYWTYSVEK